VSATRTCPLCGDEYDESTAFCAKDGTRLVTRGKGPELIGRVIADRYRIVSRLGEGGMGQVFLAEHIRMKRKSAIKIMRPALVGDVEALQRFTREAEHASQISHPNVAAIYDFGETDDGVVYLAMEYIDGEPLSRKLDREALHPDVAADILGQVADALQAAHDMEILHRDLKPDNIMLGSRSDGTYMVKLVDFGIARTMDRDAQKLTRTGFAVGTPEFMSPEQLAGDKLDSSSDQYSLALVAFVALTGKDAFSSETSKESLIARLTSRPQTLQQAKQDVEWPDELQSIFDRALSPEPADRYESVREFADSLSTAISLMTPSQTAALYRRALEQRFVSVAMRTPHSDMSSIRTPMGAQPTLSRAREENGESAGDGAGGGEAGAASSLTPDERQRRRRRILQGVGLGTLAVAAVAGLWAALGPSTPTPAGVASVDTMAAVEGGPVMDSMPSLAIAVVDTGAARGEDTLPVAAAAPVVPNADSIRAAQRERARRDSVARAERARRDSIARRAAAIERFPEAAFVAGRTTVPNWRERSVRGSDLRVVLMTPPVVAYRAEEARNWKASHVREDGSGSYQVVDPIETWRHWGAVVTGRRPVVVLEVASERVPFERLEPEKLFEFRRGDVKSVQLLRDGVPMTLLSTERYPGVVNAARHADERKAVTHSFAAVIPPELFAPRGDGTWPRMEVRVVDAMNRDREAKLQLSEQLIRRVHEDFAPYREALK
jgi:eukaryotic-like serine/threonine-protein kinase